MFLVAMTRLDSPRYAGWSNIIADVVELMKQNSEDRDMQTASIRFLACVSTNKAHHTATASTDAVKWVIAAIEKFPSYVELQAPAVFFLRYAIGFTSLWPVPPCL